MSDKLPAQRVIDAAMAYLHGKVGDGSYPEFLLAVRAYEQADDPGVVVSREDLNALLDPYCERYFEVRSRVRAALEAKR